MCSLLDKIRKFLDKILNFLLLAQKVGPSPTPIWLTLTTKLTILEMSQQQETPFLASLGMNCFRKCPLFCPISLIFNTNQEQKSPQAKSPLLVPTGGNTLTSVFRKTKRDARKRILVLVETYIWRLQKCHLFLL